MNVYLPLCSISSYHKVTAIEFSQEASFIKLSAMLEIAIVNLTEDFFNGRLLIGLKFHFNYYIKNASIV